VPWSQRERMLEAMADTFAEKGHNAITIVEVARRAGVGRKTSYEHFGNKARGDAERIEQGPLSRALR
jgi:AcrR family transcriptional regulator